MFTTKDIEAYAEKTGDYHDIHFDDNLARTRGLPGRVLHGMMCLQPLLGVDGCCVSRINAQFLLPMLPDVEYAFWTHDEQGEYSWGESSGPVRHLRAKIERHGHWTDWPTGGFNNSHGLFLWNDHEDWRAGVLGCCSYVAGMRFKGIIASADIRFRQTGYGANIVWMERNKIREWVTHLELIMLHGSETCAVANMLLVPTVPNG